MSRDNSQSWDKPLEDRITSSSLSERIRGLTYIKKVAVSGPEAPDWHDLEAISEILLHLYDYYEDIDSRNALLNTLEAIIDTDRSKYLTKFINFIDDIVQDGKPRQALTDYLTLLGWINKFIVLDTSSSAIVAQVKLLNNCVGQSYNGNKKHSKRVYHASIKSVRTSITQALTSNDQLQQVVSALLTVKDVSAQLLYAGVLTGALEDLVPTRPSLLATFGQSHSESILQVYKDALVGKKAPEDYALVSFGIFAAQFIDKDQFDTLLPVIEKSILRSSDISFGSMLPQLFAQLPSFDISDSLVSSKLLGQILSSMKSPKDHVRSGAFSSFYNILQKNVAGISEANSAKIVDEIFKALKSTSNADFKSSYLQSLRLFASPSAIAAIVDGLVAVAPKEQNETSLSCTVSALVSRYLLATANSGVSEELSNKVVKAVKTGLHDKKINLRNVWFTEVGNEVVGSQAGSQAGAFVDSIAEDLKAMLGEVEASPLPSSANKSITSGYVSLVLLGIGSGDSGEFDTRALSGQGDKPPFLTEERVISKFVTATETKWFVLALQTAQRALDKGQASLEHVSPAYGSAWLYAVCSSNVAVSSRRFALSVIRDASGTGASVANSACSRSIIESIYRELQQPSSLKISTKLLPPLLSALSSDSIENVKDLLVAANHEEVPVNNGWVGLAQRARVDLAALVEDNVDSLVNHLRATLYGAPTDGVRRAAAKSLGVMAFVAPAAMAPKLRDWVRATLTTYGIASEDVEIWRGNDGELVVDVLASGKRQVEDKNTRDYETRKWEEGVKKELASKGKIQKKLTREEQTAVNEQLQKESTIRSEVQHRVDQFAGVLLTIGELVDGAINITNDAIVWFPATSYQVLAFCRDPLSSTLLGDLPVKTFLKLAKLLSSRLGALTTLAGVATLRSYRVQGVPQHFQQEELLDLLNRLLFRIKILSDQSPLDEITVSYLLPLFERILEDGKSVALKNSNKKVVTSEFVEEDPEEELLLLTTEIISLHAEAFEVTSIPRKTVLESLISLMGLPSKAKVAKDAFLSVCQHISVTVVPGDLDLLLSHVVSKEQFVRATVLEGLDAEFDLRAEIQYSDELWIARHDTDANIAALADTIWGDNDLELVSDAPSRLMRFAGFETAGLRVAAAKAIRAAAVQLAKNGAHDGVSAVFAATVSELLNLYREKREPPPPKLDRFGLVIKSSVTNRDFWEERATVATAIKLLAPYLTTESVEQFFRLLVDERALSDREPLVRQELQDAGSEVISERGGENLELLIPIFEDALAAKDEGSREQDMVKESVVVLYGALARHLDPSDSRLHRICERMLSTLDAPSEDIQYAISECIAPLVPSLQGDLDSYLEPLFEKLFIGKKLAHRRGAAYGIAGLVKGSGIASIAKYDIVRTLTEAAEDKKNPQRREGASFAFETLSLSLGKYFEPYVIVVLPLLLKLLGDSSNEVREATELAARQIMKTTTSFGVKRLIPVTVANLDEVAWRSKKGSVELLGSMAYLDPAQLSSSLSTIVPEIVGVLNDTHKEVRRAADSALKRFGEVIRNPEIQTVVPDLISAIGDPTKHTEAALDKLMRIQFVHYIDGPSLALIIHVIHRGIRDRSASVKKKACQIVGNMSILVDAKDLKPYLATLVEELEEAMVDPVPATRSTAARALGSLVERLGEDKFPNLIPRLLDALQDKERAGDRLGSAQALAEVTSGLGVNKLDELLPIILSSAQSPFDHIRASFMPLLLFLPVTFGSQFSPYLSRIIPAILAGLADTDEEIRDTSLRAGRLIVKNYAKKAIDLLLPELQKGLSDTNYRIRLSSVELTGDLLFQVTGISGKNDAVDDQSEHARQINKSLVSVLGPERRDEVLAALFMCRSDIAGIVRSAAVDIWKALVPNTPRAVKEILPTLTTFIIRGLGSGEEEHRAIAAQTLGEMVRRVGGSALSRLLPTLEESLNSNDEDVKEGICVALYELVRSTQHEGLVEFQDTFIRIIRDSLVSSSSTVREGAAAAFEALQEQLGKVVIDEILPPLLTQLESADSEFALLGLREIMAMKSDVIFPILIPTLLTPPIDSFNAKALSSLVSVAGHALHRHLSYIINTLVEAVIIARKNFPRNQNGEWPQEVNDITAALESVVLAIDSQDGVHPLMQQLLSLTKNEDADKRAVVYSVLGPFFSSTSLDLSVYLQDMVSQFVLSLGDKDSVVVEGTFNALTALVKKQPKESLEKLVKPARQSLLLTGVTGEDLAGFTLPKGPGCILPVFLHGLMYGNSESKENSAMGIADVVGKTPAANLKGFATTLTGPLIRVIGEKVSSDIKGAILVGLTNLLQKIPQFLRPFLPQLQRTFIRSLSDSGSDSLRAKAVTALGTLLDHQPRVDPIVAELVTGAKNAESEGVKISMLQGMLQVVTKAGANMSEQSKSSILGFMEPDITTAQGRVAIEYAKLIGSVSMILTSEEAASILKNRVFVKGDESKEKFSILAINSFIKFSPQHIINEDIYEDCAEWVVRFTESPVPYISDNAIIAIGKLVLSPIDQNPLLGNQEIMEKLMTQLAIAALEPSSNSPDSRRLSLVVIRTIARLKFDDLVKNYLDILVPSVFLCVRDRIIPIKLAAEKAFLSLFHLVDDVKMDIFNKWFSGKSAFTSVTGTKIEPRSIGDYTKRVASRLAGVERERIEAGGDAETMFSDRFEDESEVWAVGGV